MCIVSLITDAKVVKETKSNEARIRRTVVIAILILRLTKTVTIAIIIITQLKICRRSNSFQKNI